MAGELFELRGSGDFESGASGVQGKGLAIVLRAADHDEAYDLADAYFQTNINGILRGSIGVADQGNDIYLITVDYSTEVFTDAASTAGLNPGPQGSQPGGGNPAGSQSPTDAVGQNYTFSTKGGTAHITRSLQTMRKVARPGETAPDYKGLIGVSKNGIEGCDIVAPNVEFSIAQKFAQLTYGYFFRLIATTGKVNKYDWKGFAFREVLFLGADGAYTPSDAWNLTCAFRYAPSDYGDDEDLDGEPDGIKIGDLEPIYEKRGHDWLWVAYEETKDANKLVKVPFAAYVERVYREGDFEVLNL